MLVLEHGHRDGVEIVIQKRMLLGAAGAEWRALGITILAAHPDI